MKQVEKASWIIINQTENEKNIAEKIILCNVCAVGLLLFRSQWIQKLAIEKVNFVIKRIERREK